MLSTYFAHDAVATRPCYNFVMYRASQEIEEKYATGAKDYSPLLHTLLVHRGISPEEAEPFLNPDYEQKILTPMHEEYVEPTKQFADAVINASDLTSGDVVSRVENNLFDR